jgi:Zn-dependent peptidase ImmA (M78 family)
MDAAKRDRIGMLADHIRTALELRVPVDVESAVARLGGSIDVVDAIAANEEIDAQVEKTGERSFRITLSRRGRYRERDRFSVAHELGHLFVHMGYLIDANRWGTIGTYKDSVKFRYGYTEEEYEANEFAGAFLMPAAAFREVAARHVTRGAYDVNAIAAAFNVSREAASVRGRWLNLFSWR